MNSKKDEVVSVPYIVYESERRKSDGKLLKAVISIVVLVCILIGSNVVWAMKCLPKENNVKISEVVL